MAQQLFKKADVDGSGGISKDELKTIVESRPAGATHSGQGPNLDDLFSTIDTDGNGTISESENEAQLKAMGPVGPPDPSRMAKMMFEKADTNGTGQITKSQLLDSLQSGRQDSTALASLFDGADSDGDGVISQTDLQSSLTALLKDTSKYQSDGSFMSRKEVQLSTNS